MEKTKVKKYFEKLSEESKKILTLMVGDSLAYLDSQIRVNNKIIVET